MTVIYTCWNCKYSNILKQNLKFWSNYCECSKCHKNNFEDPFWKDFNSGLKPLSI